MPKTAEKPSEPTLALDGAVNEPVKAQGKGRALAAHKGQSVERAPVASIARSDAQALMDMVERASRDPAVDIDKFERILQMRERIVAQEREHAFNEAMAKAQEEMKPVAVDASNKETHSKFASHAALDRALRPVYTKHGFALSYNTEPHASPEMMNMVCYATACNHTRKYLLELPCDGKGAKGGAVMSRVHATSSGATYGMRILLKMVFNIAVDRDDDGNAAGKTAIKEVDDSVPKITQAQIDALIDKCEAVGCPRPKFLAWAKCEKFEHIPAAFYDGCIAGLNEFKKAK